MSVSILLRVVKANIRLSRSPFLGFLEVSAQIQGREVTMISLLAQAS